MDDDGLNISPQEIQKLNPNDYKELQQFLANEGQKSQVQKSMSPIFAKCATVFKACMLTLVFPAVHDLTETCFKKCITSSITTGKLASKEESCMTNCVERFMDSNLAVLKHLETLRSHQ